MLAIMGDGYGNNRACMPLKASYLFTTVDIPQFNGFILTPRDDILSIMGDGCGFDRTCVPLKTANNFTTVEIPEFDILIITSRDEEFSIRTKCYKTN